MRVQSGMLAELGPARQRESTPLIQSQGVSISSYDREIMGTRGSVEETEELESAAPAPGCRVPNVHGEGAPDPQRGLIDFLAN